MCVCVCVTRDFVQEVGGDGNIVRRSLYDGERGDLRARERDCNNASVTKRRERKVEHGRVGGPVSRCAAAKERKFVARCRREIG